MLNRNKEFYDEYIYFLGTQKSSRKNTSVSYSIDVKQFLEYINVEATEVKIREVDSWLSSLKGKTGKPIKAATYNRKIASLNHFYDKYMIKSGYTEINPFSMVELIEIVKGNDKESNQIVRDFLTIEEVERFKKVLEQEVKRPTLKTNCTKEMAKMSALRYRAIFNLVIESGLRIEELLSLELNEITISGDKAEIFIPKTKDKSKRGRKVPVPLYVINYIKEYRRNLRIKPSNNYVFVSNNGNKLVPNVISTKLKECVKLAEINKYITNHSLRHTYGSLKLNRDNENIVNVSKWMGHSTPAFTAKIYHHTETITEGTTLADII